MKFIIQFLFFSLISFATMASNQKLPLEAFGALPSKNMVVISPSGNRIAYRTTSSNKDYMVIFDLVANKMVTAVDASQVKPTDVFFIDENKLIFVAVETSKIRGFKGVYDNSVAFIYDIEKASLHQILTAGLGIYEGQSSLGQILAISPDHKHAYMPAWTSSRHLSLVKADLTRKKRPTIVSKGRNDVIDYFVAPDGTKLARERYNNNSNRHVVEAFRDDNWEVIYEETAELRSKAISGLTADRKYLVIKSFDYNIMRWAYFKMSLADGSISDAIFSNKHADVEYLITDINRVVYGAAYSGFKPSYEFFDKKLTKRFNNLAKAMPNNSFILQDYTHDWSSIIVRVEGEGSPGDYYKFSGGNLQFLASRRDDIAPEQVNPVEIRNFVAKDGLTIPTLLTSPVNSKQENLPTIMLPHGGPESYDRLSFDWMAQYFASQGYLVIQPQFRGSSGFGERHTQLGEGEWGLKMQTDLTDTLNVLIDEGKVDKSRVCIVGASYGGYAALAGVSFEPDVYKCAVSIAGVSDIEQMIRDEKRQNGKNHWVVSYWQRIISDGKVAKKHLDKISPVNFVKDINAPVLLIHGEHDLVVPLRQSKVMYDELSGANKQVEYIELEEGDHYLNSYQNRMKTLQAIDKFVKKHI